MSCGDEAFRASMKHSAPLLLTTHGQGCEVFIYIALPQAFLYNKLTAFILHGKEEI